LVKNDAVKNLVVGLGISIVVPIAVKLLVPVAKPLARGVLKTGIVAYEKGRETMAEISEVVDDLVAEVQEELQEAREREALEMEMARVAEESAAQDAEKR
jgi:gas vesicle protein